MIFPIFVSVAGSVSAPNTAAIGRPRTSACVSPVSDRKLWLAKITESIWALSFTNITGMRAGSAATTKGGTLFGMWEATEFSCLPKFVLPDPLKHYRFFALSRQVRQLLVIVVGGARSNVGMSGFQADTAVPYFYCFNPYHPLTAAGS